MANFCLATGVQPSEYLNLTQLEVDEFAEQARKMTRK